MSISHKIRITHVMKINNIHPTVRLKVIHLTVSTIYEKCKTQNKHKRSQEGCDSPNDY